MAVEVDRGVAPTRVTARFSLAFFVAIHLSCLLAFLTGVHRVDVALCMGLYWLRMFGITAGYHRYFAHRTYKTSRWFQFVLAWTGAMSVQKGPLWWASWHRIHHRYSDTPRDVHSPVQRGFWYSHLGWFVGTGHDATDLALIPDFARFPELRWLNRFFWVPPLALGLFCAAVDGARGLVWGFSISTVLCWHGTFTINSLAHVWGSRRYATTDTSRNNLVLALITMGEGWHNNHHHYMNSANQGFFWWEIDLSYYVLRAFAAVGLVRDLRRPPRHVLQPKLLGAGAGAGIAHAKQAAELKLAEARLAVSHAVDQAVDAASEAVDAVAAKTNPAA